MKSIIIPNDPKDIPFSTRFRWWKSKKVALMKRFVQKFIKKKSILESISERRQ